ncbi:MAG: ectoine synthase [Pseudomonadota bacterium]|nr:ectoine synthase [Pseudomonadota bacterium]
MDGKVYPIKVGDIYVLDRRDRHIPRGGKSEDMILVSVINPPLTGAKRRNLSQPGGSAN